MTHKRIDNLIDLPFQNADLHNWTWGVAHLLLEIAIMATPWIKICQILFSRNCVYMFVDLEKRLFVQKKNTSINIDYSLSLSNDSVTQMSTLMYLSTPLSLTLYNDNPMSLSLFITIIPCVFHWFKLTPFLPPLMQIIFCEHL